MSENLPVLSGTDPRLEDWLLRLKHEERELVLNMVKQLVKYSEQPRHQGKFDGSGLYVVGSSIDRKYNDIDIVLAGLDFRAVFQYNKIFLQDPKTLIDKGVVMEPNYVIVKDIPNSWFQEVDQEATTKELYEEHEGGVEIYKPPEFKGLDVLGRAGIEFEGKRYDYALDEHLLDAMDMDNYCERRGRPSHLIEDIYRLFFKDENQWCDGLYSPFEPYFNRDDMFLVTGFSIFPADKYEFDSCQPVPEVPELPFKHIDFLVHGENLKLGSWKFHQGMMNYDFLAIHEWPQCEGERFRIHNEDLPGFIDPKGEGRVQQHMYTYHVKDFPK